MGIENCELFQFGLQTASLFIKLNFRDTECSLSQMMMQKRLLLHSLTVLYTHAHGWRAVVQPQAAVSHNHKFNVREQYTNTEMKKENRKDQSACRHRLMSPPVFSQWDSDQTSPGN